MFSGKGRAFHRHVNPVTRSRRPPPFGPGPCSVCSWNSSNPGNSGKASGQRGDGPEPARGLERIPCAALGPGVDKEHGGCETGSDIAGNGRGSHSVSRESFGDGEGIPEVTWTARDVGGPSVEPFGMINEHSSLSRQGRLVT